MEKIYMPNTQRIMRKRLELQKKHTKVYLRIRDEHGCYFTATFCYEEPLSRISSIEQVHPDDRELVPDWLWPGDPPHRTS